MNNVYPLNLPALLDILKPGISLESFKNNIIHYPNIEDLVSSKFTSMLNLKFTKCILFYKTPFYKSRIHIDHDDWDKNGKNKFVWGINWTFGGRGRYSFWKESDIENYTVERNPQNRLHVLLNTKTKPYEEYFHYSGAVLFNATLPHQIINQSTTDRYAISIRTDLQEESWDHVVETFKPLIIDYSQNIKRIL